MTQVRREIERHGQHLQGKTSVLFVIMKNPVDTSTHSDFETNFRKRWGMPVSNEFAQDYNLPFHTEWVLTTQSFITYMSQVIQAASQGGRINATIFKGITFDSGSNLPPGFLQYRRNYFRTMNITVVEMVARSEFDFLMMYITEIVISFKYSAIVL